MIAIEFWCLSYFAHVFFFRVDILILHFWLFHWGSCFFLCAHVWIILPTTHITYGKIILQPSWRSCLKPETTIVLLWWEIKSGKFSANLRRTASAVGSASDFGTEGCAFEPASGQIFFFYYNWVQLLQQYISGLFSGLTDTIWVKHCVLNIISLYRSNLNAELVDFSIEPNRLRAVAKAYQTSAFVSLSRPLFTL